MSRFSHSPPPPPRREEDRDRFSRTNFAPLPNRHEELGITAGRSSGDSYIPPPPPARDDRRGREPLPVRERDAALGPPGPGPGVGGPVGREFRDERDLRDERPRRPPPHWEEEGMFNYLSRSLDDLLIDQTGPNVVDPLHPLSRHIDPDAIHPILTHTAETMDSLTPLPCLINSHSSNSQNGLGQIILVPPKPTKKSIEDTN